MSINPLVFASTMMTCKDKSPLDLHSAVMCQLRGYDPTIEPWYYDLKALYTEDGGQKMHGDVLAVLQQIVSERLP